MNELQPGQAVRLTGRRRDGVAYRVIGPALEWVQITCLATDPETGEEYEADTGDWEQQENHSRIRCHMVGDDHIYTFDPDELEPLDPTQFCGSCGQIGCLHGAQTDG